MMIFWTILLVVTIIWLLIMVTLLILKNKKLKKLNITITDEIVKTKQQPIIIGKLDKYKEEELEILLSNPDIIDLLVRIYEYKIFMKTDSIRSLDETEKKVWFLNCLHSEHLFFYKLQQKLNKKKEKVWQSLI